MAYVPHNWQDGELITQDSLNDMENGIFKNSNSNVISVDNYEREAIENTDDGMLQRIFDSALDNSVIIFQNKKEYIVTTGILIKDKTNLKVIGNNSKVSFSGDNDNVFAFQYSGSVDKLDISGFTISGLNTNGKKTAFGGLSGNNLTNSMIHHLIIDSVNVGISLNADLGGIVENNKVYLNRITNILGSESGNGYGIHMAYGNFTHIFGNYLENVGRHSVYVAEGNDIDIYNNTIKNHRIANPTNQYRPAINITRKSVNIRVTNNEFLNVRDSCLQIGNQNEKGNMENVVVSGNLFKDWDGIPAIRIGADTTSVDPYNGYNITVENNTFVTSSIQTAITTNMGIGVNILGNKIRYTNPTNRINVIVVSPTITGALDDVIIKRNIISIAQGDETSQARGITFQELASSGNIRIEANDNVFNNLFSDSGKNYFDYFSPVAITNPNLNYISNRVIIKKVSAPTTGYHEAGEIAYSSYPSSTKNVGWVCTVAGAPGTWVAFGTF